MNIEIQPFDACPYVELLHNSEQKIGHVRADHDSSRWWTTWWTANEALMTESRRLEIDCVCGHLLEVLLKNGSPDILALCAKYPQTVVGDPNAGEYNFFVDGAECGYWVRFIDRPRDYNLYLHCFVKLTDNGGDNHEH